MLSGHSFVHRDGGCATSQNKGCGSWKVLRVGDLDGWPSGTPLLTSAVITSPDLIRGRVPVIPMD